MEETRDKNNKLNNFNNNNDNNNIRAIMHRISRKY